MFFFSVAITEKNYKFTLKLSWLVLKEVKYVKV